MNGASAFQALDIRLNEMAKGFEEATIDKNTQEEKTITMDKQLETAARLRKVMLNNAELQPT